MFVLGAVVALNHFYIKKRHSIQYFLEKRNRKTYCLTSADCWSLSSFLNHWEATSLSWIAWSRALLISCKVINYNHLVILVNKMERQTSWKQTLRKGKLFLLIRTIKCTMKINLNDKVVTGISANKKWVQNNFEVVFHEIF